MTARVVSVRAPTTQWVAVHSRTAPSFLGPAGLSLLLMSALAGVATAVPRKGSPYQKLAL